MDTTKLSITKNSVECYKIRHQSGSYWADITIDSKGTTGRLQIASDYGSWQYYWGACGCPFKEFLTQLDIGYVAGKFGESKWFDAEKTAAFYRQTIVKNRREGDLTGAEARAMYDEVKFIEEINNECEFYHAMQADCPNIMKYFNYCPDSITTISPSFRMFWDNIWQYFINELKKEE